MAQVLERVAKLRVEEGPVGAPVNPGDVGVVVDVLSFSTSVCVAVGRGMVVLPSRWRGPEATELARAHDAVLAAGRGDAPGGAPSLSPAGLLVCEVVPRLVLPSPNGSSLSVDLREAGAEVVVGCLRNARAVARWLAPALRAGRSVTVVAAGERFDGDSLRPALEDRLGAGAVVSHLRAAGLAGGASEEALAAADLFDASREHLADRLAGCVSGRELVGRGFADDVAVAAALDASGTVPVLVGGAFVGDVVAGH